MSLLKGSFLFRAAVIFAGGAVLLAVIFTGFLSGVAVRFKPVIESRIESALPAGFDVSISEVMAVPRGGFEIRGVEVSSDGRDVVTARSVFFSYGSALYAFFETLAGSAEIEVDGVEVFLPSPGAGVSSVPGGPSASVPFRLPKIRVTNSAFVFQGVEVAIHNSLLSLASVDGNMKISVEQANMSIPNRGVSISGFALEAGIGTAGLLNARGNGTVETPKGNADVEFKISVPKEKGPLWEGSVSVSGMSVLGRKTGFSISSVTFERDGLLSVYGKVLMGGLSSLVRVKVETPGGGLLPVPGPENKFEFEGNFFKRDIPSGGIKIVGSLMNRDSALFITGKVPKEYRDRLDVFGVRRLESEFSVSLNGMRFNSAELFIKSRNFLIETDIHAYEAGLTANYKIESDDVFYLSNITRSLSLYEMNGSLKSEGVFERNRGGRMTVSGHMELKRFAFAVSGGRIGLEKGEFDFLIPVPVSSMSIDRLFMKSSIKDLSYGDTLVEKADVNLAYGSVKAGIKFKDSASIKFAGNVSGRSLSLDDMEIEAGDMSLNLAERFSVNIKDGRIDVTKAEFFGDRSLLRFEGSYGYGNRVEGVRVQADLLGLTTEVFEPFYPALSAHRGRVGGGISIGGSADWPVVDLSLRYRSSSGGDTASLSVVRPDTSERFSFTLLVNTGYGSVLDLSGGLSPTDGHPLKIGEIMRGPDNYDLVLRARKFTIKPVGLLSDKIRNLEGSFSGDLSVFRTDEGFDTDGRIDIDLARVKVGDWTEVIEIRPGSTLDFKGDSVSSSLILKDSFGSARLKGVFNLKNYSYTSEAVLAGLFLHINHLYSGFFGTLFIDGNGRNIRIRAKDLKTSGANIWIKKNLNIAVAGLVFVDNDEDGGFAKGRKSGFFAHTSDMDFRLLISDDTRFRLDRVNAILSGELHVKRKFGDDFSSVEGNLKVVRGSYTLLGKQFDIDRGSISLSAREHLTPIVDINALYERTGLSVKANLQGDTGNLNLNLSSVPAMKEDEIILALLARGIDDRATDIADVVGGVNRQTDGSWAVGYAADQLFSSLVDNNPFGFVDAFSITRRGGGVLESEIEAGAYITDRIYTTYQRVSETSLPISTSYKNRFSARYLIGDHLILEAIAGGLTPGVDLLFNIDFK